MEQHPSLFNKVMSGSEEYSHVLSAPTLKLLESYNEKLLSAGRQRSVEVDPEVISNLLNAPHDKRMLDLWVRLKTPVKVATLDILEAITRLGNVG
jgi:hypothetical protein